MATATRLGLHPSFAILPFLSSSLTLFYAFVEPTVFIPWVRSADTELTATNRALRIWWNHFYTPSLSTILSITIPTIFTGGYAIAKLQSHTREWRLYAAGTAFTVGHYVFAAPIVDAINHMNSEEVEKTNGNVEWLKKWLRIHAWRTITTDIPSVVCFGLLVFGSS